MIPNFKKTTSYITISVMFLLLCFLTILYVYSPRTLTKRIQLQDFVGFDNAYELARLEDLFAILFSDTKHMYKEIRVYSVFDTVHTFEKPNGVLTVQYSAEGVFNNPSNYDINIIPGKREQHNVLSMPYMAATMFVHNVDLHAFTRRRILQKQNQKHTKFCLFAVSSPVNPRRNEFFTSLTKYKPVDSCGKVFNNLGYSCPGNHQSPDFHTFISQYKFMICFENSSLENYFTEKLLNAYKSNTIPIYWGCPNVGEYINLSSILYLPPNYTEEDVVNLIQEIERLDNDDELYRKKYESVFFKNGVVPDDFLPEKIKEKINTILHV